MFYVTLPLTVPAELWLSLEEHQYALELIMGRYRKQMLQLMMAKKELDTKPVLSLHEDHAKVWQMSSKSSKSSVLWGLVYERCSSLTHLQEVQSQVERICEMGQVMRRAVQVDDQHYCSVRERLAQLEVSLWIRLRTSRKHYRKHELLKSLVLASCWDLCFVRLSKCLQEDKKKASANTWQGAVFLTSWNRQQPIKWRLDFWHPSNNLIVFYFFGGLVAQINQSHKSNL